MKTKSLILILMCVLFQANTLSFAETQTTGKNGKRVQVPDKDGITEVDNEVLPGTLENQDPPRRNVVKVPDPQTRDQTLPATQTTNPPPKQVPVNTDTSPVVNHKSTIAPATDQGTVPSINRPTQTTPSTKGGAVAPAHEEGATPVVVPRAAPVPVPAPVSLKGGVAPANNPGSVVDTNIRNSVEASASAPAPKPAPVAHAPLELEQSHLDGKLEEKPLEDLNTFISASKTNPTKNACEDKALGDIYKLLLSDNNNVLGIMFELTAMRLAKRTLEQQQDSKYATFEDLAVNEIKKLNTQVDKLDKDKTVQDQVRKVYETYGKKTDDKIVSDRLDEMKRDASDAAKRAADACYFEKEKRFKNNEASAFIMAAVIGEGGDLTASTKDNPAKLTDIDAATIWVVEHTRDEAAKTNPEYKIGGGKGNMLNVSTRVTRYLGRIAGGRKELSPTEMEGLIEKEQNQIKEIVKNIFDDSKSEAKNNIQKDLKACLKVANPNCEDCQITDKVNALETVNLDVDRIQRGLLETVAKSDNLKVEKDLRAKLGPMFLDFNSIPDPTVKVTVQTGESDQDLGHDFAKETDAPAGTTPVPHLPPRGTKEICKKFWVNKSGSKAKGHSVAKHATSGTKKAQARSSADSDASVVSPPAQVDSVHAPKAPAVVQKKAAPAVVKPTAPAQPTAQDFAAKKDAPKNLQTTPPPAPQAIVAPASSAVTGAGTGAGTSGIQAMRPGDSEFINGQSAVTGLDSNTALDDFVKTTVKKKKDGAARDPGSATPATTQSALDKLATPGNTKFKWGTCDVSRQTKDGTSVLEFKSKGGTDSGVDAKDSYEVRVKRAAEICGVKP